MIRHFLESGGPAFSGGVGWPDNEGILPDGQLYLVTEVELFEPNLGDAYASRVADADNPGANRVLHEL
jgi:hypothetical protein